VLGRIVALRSVTPGDAIALGELFADPSVVRWWGNFDDQRLRSEILDPSADTVSFVIEVEGAVAGLIQYSEENEPAYRHAGIDIAVGSPWQGRGVGPDAMRTLARHLFEERGHHRLTIDPAVGNVRAIRAYERVGFRPVGIMRQYERGPDGVWHDGMLMDMLRGELLTPADL
jgi:aminoglycoside 6'-N-acetyltransferase